MAIVSHFVTSPPCRQIKIVFYYIQRRQYYAPKWGIPFGQKAHYSPRAQTLLFMFLSANGLMVVSIVETCQEFKKPSIVKNNLSVFSEFSFKHGYRRKI